MCPKGQLSGKAEQGQIKNTGLLLKRICPGGLPSVAAFPALPGSKQKCDAEVSPTLTDRVSQCDNEVSRTIWGGGRGWGGESEKRERKGVVTMGPHQARLGEALRGTVSATVILLLRRAGRTASADQGRLENPCRRQKGSLPEQLRRGFKLS